MADRSFNRVTFAVENGGLSGILSLAFSPFARAYVLSLSHHLMIDALLSPIRCGFYERVAQASRSS